MSDSESFGNGLAVQTVTINRKATGMRTTKRQIKTCQLLSSERAHSHTDPNTDAHTDADPNADADTDALAFPAHTLRYSEVQCS